MSEKTPTPPLPEKKSSPDNEETFVRKILGQMGVITSPVSPDPVATIKKNPGLLPDLLDSAKGISAEDKEKIRRYFDLPSQTVMNMVSAYEQADPQLKEYIRSTIGVREHSDASFGIQESIAPTGGSMKTAILERALRRAGWKGTRFTNANTDLFYKLINAEGKS